MRDVSLRNELAELADALEGARVLAEDLRNEGFSRRRDYIEAPRMIAATINTVIARLNLIYRCISGIVDPSALVSGYNEPLPPVDDPEQQDVVLRKWSSVQRAEFAKRELRRGKKAIAGKNKSKKRKSK